MNAPRVEVLDLLSSARAGDHRAMGRLLTLVERSPYGLPELAAAGALGKAHRIGITGPPGAGKSTLTSALVLCRRESAERVAVLAVDPSSPFSGGALLGDRVRMMAHVRDRDVYIRSMASRGQLGGLAVAAAAAVDMFDAAAFDTVFIETVGVGQSEIEVAAVADTTVLVVAPGAGDEVQAAKAGVVEIADLIVVNKADHEGAEVTVRQLRHALALRSRSSPDTWPVPVLRTTATTSEGISQLSAGIADHRQWLASSGHAESLRRERAAGQIRAIAHGRLDAALRVPTELADAVAERRIDPWAAAQQLLPGLL